MQIEASIFKAYDIRGIIGTQLTEKAAYGVGRGLATLARSKAASGETPTIVVGRDGRLSGPSLARALADGIRASGVHVIDIGVVATPMVYFAAKHYGCESGVMVTGSHNPPEYNGLKMVIAGETLAGEAIQALRATVEADQFIEPGAGGIGTIETRDIGDIYIQRIVSDVKLARPMNITIDCGNGSPGAFAGKLYRALGCTVAELFCEVDGNFPNHHPDPSKPENLKDLIDYLGKNDTEIGLAFDGDGDRLGVVTKDGAIIYPDRQLMLFAEDVLSRNPGAEIIFDVKCTRHLFAFIRERGGKPLLWKTGHSLIKAKMKETGALLAGEMSGHVFFKERWYGFDDGLYVGARLLEILSKRADITATLKALPDAISTPELNWKLSEGEPHALINALQKTATFTGANEVITIDGLRVEYPDGFGLARASNTTPVIVLRFEADTTEALERIKADFARVLQPEKPNIPLPY